MTLIRTSTLGLPRMGPNRELKFALEKFWKGLLSHKELDSVAKKIETMGWELQLEASLDKITVGDFYLYDMVLTWSESLNLVPRRFQHIEAGLNRVFAMARGVKGAEALSMKKWITSNYHFLVPEWDDSTSIKPNFAPFLANVQRGKDFLGANKAVPVVLGPVSLVYLTKIMSSDTKESVLSYLLPHYVQLFDTLASMGVSEIQIHEPALVFADELLLPLYKLAYPFILPRADHGPAINMVASFMDDVGDANYQWLVSVKELTIVSLDFTRGNTFQLIEKHGFPLDKILGAGLIDCRNVWKAEPNKMLALVERLMTQVAALSIQPSGSLQYLPWDLDCEAELMNHQAAKVLSFAKQKLTEVMLISQAANGKSSALEGQDLAWRAYKAKVHVQPLTMWSKSDFVRAEPFQQRRPKQLQELPLLPTTTIGSFPQTTEIRRLRAQFKLGKLSKQEYEGFIDQQIAFAIGLQEALGLDILVHGEAERTDMVEFFAQQLEGMLFTSNGWVQSFGSRCIRPPIIWSDIVRPKPMTVREFKVAQNLTSKPVKGMLTGPITILNWSFPRVDMLRKDQALQLALCIRQEVADLETAGCRVIQVDEPALREGMPLREAEKEVYLDWAVDAFCFATGGAKGETQIHTHMCYCEFKDCMNAIDRMDTDVNSIENARNGNETLEAFVSINYQKGFGPGVYDIHSPVVPSVAFMEGKIKSFLTCLEVEKVVVNPDCGLKTRSWPETIAALKNMVAAAENVRREIQPIA